jgi:hypothetical protein
MIHEVCAITYCALRYLSHAAFNGHLDIVQWAHENEDTCAEAARGGHLDVLQWARANGCPWDERICANNAAEYGHVDILQWAQWTEQIFSNAA